MEALFLPKQSSRPTATDRKVDKIYGCGDHPILKSETSTLNRSPPIVKDRTVLASPFLSEKPLIFGEAGNPSANLAPFAQPRTIRTKKTKLFSYNLKTTPPIGAPLLLKHPVLQINERPRE